MARNKRQAKKLAQRARVRNNIERSSGIGTEFDFGQAQFPSTFQLSPMQQDEFAVNLYYTDWSAKKIVTIPVEDMLRDGWDYEGVDDDQRDRLVTLTDELGALESIKSAMRLERLVGGAVIFMGIADGQESPEHGVNFDALKPGCLRFLNVIARNRVSKIEYENDPLSPAYGRPLHYWINGQRVHRSRLIIFDGDPLLKAPDSTVIPTNFSRNDGFGTSVLIPIFDDLTRATGSRQAAYQLVQRASVFLFQTDTLDLESTTEGQNKLRVMQDIINQINLFRGAVVDRAPGQSDPITTISPQFGSVPELVMSFIQILSAASDIPATRFLGQAPGGLNATGESDLENYYGRLESDQKQSLRPKLMKLLQVMGRSCLGEAFSDVKVDVKFAPLWSMSELEQSQIRTADITNVVSLLLENLITDAEALDELRLRDALLADIKREDELAQSDGPTPSLGDIMSQLEGSA